MDLILWRHAEAEDGFPDESRMLTPKGHKQARKMAAWLKSHLPKHAGMLVSPAVRTQQTAAALRADFVTSADAGLSTNPVRLLKAVHWPQARQAMIVVGHQPTLGMTAARLITGREADWSVRRGSVVWIEHKEARNVLRAVISPDMV
jgi:phosphohistidine phosphatase